MSAASTTTESAQTIGQAVRRPAWAQWGGLAITAGGVLLMAATLLEVPLAEAADGGLLGVFTALFLGSTVAHALAMIPLSGGRSGADGAVGSSQIGRFALLGFGAVFFTMQTVYYTVSYALPSTPDPAGALTVSAVLGVVQLALLLTGAIAIARAGVATGAARWALLVLTAVVAVTGAVAGTAGDPTTVTAALLCSTGAQVVVGIVLMTASARRR